MEVAGFDSLVNLSMKKQCRDSLSFVTMTVLVFVLINLAMGSDVSTSANEDLSFGWLELHRHGLNWSIQHFYFGALALQILMSLVLTWIASKILHRRST